MTTIAVKCCDAVTSEPKVVCIRPEPAPVPEWRGADLDIQSFIRLASGGVEAGFDRILIK